MYVDVELTVFVPINSGVVICSQADGIGFQFQRLGPLPQCTKVKER